jgi:hypothetical protein
VWVGWLSCSSCDNSWGSVVVSCWCEKLAAEAGDRSGTQRKWKVRRWKPLSNNGSEVVIVEISGILCNIEL